MAITNILQVCIATIIFTYAKMPWGLNEVFHFIEYVFLPATGVFQLTRLALIGLVITLNNLFGRKLSELATPRVGEVHKMLTQAINTNVLFTCLFTRVPLIFSWGASTLGNVAFINVTVTVTTCLQQSVMVGEMLIMLYYVNPYNRFIVALFKRKAVPVNNLTMSSANK
uniref:VUT family protein n=1 Tax=Panagrellus redivivus TaxID=6233 RepID=A0A7E4VWU4_PANRE